MRTSRTTLPLPLLPPSLSLPPLLLGVSVCLPCDLRCRGLETMLLVTTDFVSRLAAHYAKADNEAFSARYNEPLPLADFFQARSPSPRLVCRLVVVVLLLVV